MAQVVALDQAGRRWGMYLGTELIGEARTQEEAEQTLRSLVETIPLYQESEA